MNTTTAADAATDIRDTASTEADSAQFYVFPASRLGEAVAAIENANRRLVRAGVQAQFSYSTEESLVPVRVEGVATGTMKSMVILALSAPVLRFSGWEFIATLVHEEAGVIARTVPGRSLDGFTPATDRTCDHCGTNRARKDTYLVRHVGSTGPDGAVIEAGTGEVKQVGSNCLAAFLGIRPAGLWALEFELDASFTTGDDSDARTGGVTDYRVPVTDVIAYALAASDGGASFVPRSAVAYGGTATVDIVRMMMWGTASQRADLAEQIAAVEGIDAALIEKVLDAAHSIEGDGDYPTNMRILASGEYVDERNMALLVSAIGAWNRAEQREAQRTVRAEITKGHLGVEGEKISDVGAVITGVRFTDGFRYDTTNTILTMIATATGHQIKWFASSRLDYQQGDTVLITRATVKKHDTWQGTDETVITRAKLTKAETP
jgi:hypothetical protein